jgi:hypothetical protein
MQTPEVDALLMMGGYDETFRERHRGAVRRCGL